MCVQISLQSRIGGSTEHRKYGDLVSVISAVVRDISCDLVCLWCIQFSTVSSKIRRTKHIHPFQSQRQAPDRPSRGPILRISPL